MEGSSQTEMGATSYLWPEAVVSVGLMDNLALNLHTASSQAATRLPQSIQLETKLSHALLFCRYVTPPPAMVTTWSV